MRTSNIRIYVLFFLFLSTVFVKAQNTTSKAEQAASLIRAKQYPQALKILNGDLAALSAKAPSFTEDQLTLMKARALHLNKQHADAETVCDTFNQKFPNSEWKYKITFLKAHTHAARGDYEAALKIYEAEATRLFSEKRKDEVAASLIEFADFFATLPAPEDLDAPKPDFEKAYTLYKEVLDLQCSIKVKEQAHYSMIRMSGHLSNWQRVVADSISYLPKYDPSWRGEMASQERLTFQPNTSENPKNIIGLHRSEVRYRMAEALHRQNQRPLAARYLDEVTALMEANTIESPAGLKGDAAWLKLMAMRKQGGKSPDITLWVEAAQAYLKTFPNHLHASSTSYMIPSMLASHDKQEDAIAAYLNFLANPIQVTEKPISLEKETHDQFIKRKDKANKNREEASYQIGSLHLQLLQFDQARAAWQQTTKDYPNGSRWADSQKGLVNIDFTEAMQSIRQIYKAEDKSAAAATASTHLEQFLKKHPLSDHAPNILFLLGKIPHQQAVDMDEIENITPQQTDAQNDLFKKAITTWDELLSKYPKSPKTTHARELIGAIYENRLHDLEKALSIYRATKSSSAQNSIELLTSKRLIASSTQVFRTDEDPTITLNLRNIEKVTVRQYWLDLESYFRKARKLSNISELDVDLVEPDKTWDIEIEDYQKYLPLEKKIPIPFANNRPGVCVIKVEGGGFLSTTSVVRSDIDIAIRSGKNELLAFATNWRKGGTPTSGVDILIADGGKIISSGKTGPDGVLHLKSEKLATITDLRILARSSTGAATCDLDFSHLIAPPILLEKAWFNTPQQWYRPGDTVHLSGLLRVPHQGTYQVPPDKQRQWKLRCIDMAGGKLIHESDITLNNHGSFSSSFTVPKNMSQGNITATISRKEGDQSIDFNTRIVVKNQTRDRVLLTLDFPKTWTAPGEKVTGQVTANYHWGAPVSDRQVEITLPNNLTLKVTTNNEGIAKFNYDTSMLPSGSVAKFMVKMPSESSQPVSKILDIDPLGFSVEAELSHGTIASGEVFEVIAKTLLPDGTVTDRELTLEVIQQSVEKDDPILDSTFESRPLLNRSIATPQQTRQTSPILEKVIQTHNLTTDETTGLAKQQITLKKGGRFILRIRGKDSRGRLVFAESFIEIYGTDSHQKIRLLVDKNKLREGGEAKIEAWSRLDTPTHALLSIEADTLIEYRVVKLAPGKNPITVKLNQRHAPVFRAAVMAMHKRKFYSGDEILPVERTLKVITKIDGLSEDGETSPGGKLKVNVKLLDGNDQPQSGEVSLSLIDQRDPHREIYNHHFIRSHRLAGFAMGTSCGFQHQGTQTPVNLALREEEARIATATNRRARRAENEINAALAQSSASIEEIRKQIYLGETHYNLGQYDKAHNAFVNILRQDKYNKAARRWLERIASVQSDYYRSAYDHTRAQLLNEVDRAWELELPNTLGGFTQDLSTDESLSVNNNDSFWSVSGGGASYTAQSSYGLISNSNGILNQPNRNSIDAIIDNKNGRGFSNNSYNANWSTYNYRKKNQAIIELQGISSLLTDPTSTHSHQPTLIWELAQQVVDKKGSNLEIPLPKTSGSWKLLTQGSTISGNLGQNVDKIVTALPYDIDLQLPSTVIEGDQITPVILVTRKNTEAAENIKLSYLVNNGETQLETSEHTVTFAVGESTKSITTKTFPVPAATSLDIHITSDKDIKLSQVLPIRPWGLPVADHSSLLLSPGKKSITLELPAGTHQKEMRLHILPSMSNALNHLATGSLASWCGYRIPFHQEHAAGQLLAIVSVIDHHRKKGIADQQLSSLLTRANQLTAELAVTRNQDGAWSSVRGRSATDLAYTAMAFEALTRAKEMNITIDETTWGTAKTWLEKHQVQIHSGNVDARSLVQYALSCADAADFSACNRLFRERGKLGDAGKALLAATFVNLNRPENAKTLLSAMAGHGDWKDQSSLIHFTHTFIAGRALSAASVVAPEGNLANTLRDIILNNSGIEGFTSDLDRGAALVGLTSFQEKADATDATITINLNNTLLGEFTSDKPELMANINIDPKLLVDGKNTISLSMTGKGQLIAAATLNGFSPLPDEHKVDEQFAINKHRYYHEGLSFQGKRLKASGTSPAKTVQKGERVQVHFRVQHQRPKVREVVVVERIPAGFVYEVGTLKGNHSGARIESNHLVITFDGRVKNRYINYSMIARHPGTWRQPPTLLLPLRDPASFAYGNIGTLTVIGTKEKNPDPYVTNSSEHSEIASLHFKQGQYAKAREHIMAVRKIHPTWENTTNSRMLLWIECARENPDAKLLVESFEILNERSPELVIPFDIILKVGKAYQTLKEHERGMEVFTATIGAGFAKDSYIGAALEDQGRFLDSIDYQKELWALYPDEGVISTAWFALAQQLYEKSSTAKDMQARKDQKKAPSEIELISEASALFETFLLANPENPLADDAAFTQANVLFSLKKFKEVVAHANTCISRYPDSKHAGSFRYMTALGSFWLRDYDAALKAASEVAQGSSEDKNLASYITAQVYHAKGQPLKATEWYDRVKSIYPDARESIAYFEQKMVRLEEAKILKSGEKAELTLHYRNIKEANIQIYRVDLMKLYLREKNLSNIANVNLAGISPKHEMTIKLGNGEDFQDQEKKITLPVKDDGAYLMICRGDYLYTSGLVLITPLKMEVQEDLTARSLRVNISDQGTGKYLDNVHVKTIGINDTKFKSGETDLRGIWKAENITSRPTIIARDEKGRYAFYRSKSQFAATPTEDSSKPQQEAITKPNFKSNLLLRQNELNEKNRTDYETIRRSKGKGVKAKEALKK